VLMVFSFPVIDHVDRDGVQGTIHTRASAGDRDPVARASTDRLVTQLGQKGERHTTVPRVRGQGSQGGATRVTGPGVAREGYCSQYGAGRRGRCVAAHATWPGEGGEGRVRTRGPG